MKSINKRVKQLVDDVKKCIKTAIEVGDINDWINLKKPRGIYINLKIDENKYLAWVLTSKDEFDIKKYIIQNTNLNFLMIFITLIKIQKNN